MNFNDTLDYIQTAHHGQKYGDKPYWTHPLAVANRLNTDDEELKIIALLHDVVEDTDTTFEDLSELGYSERVIAALRLLTKEDGETYESYMYRLTNGMKKQHMESTKLKNMDAILVKLADNAENSSEDNLVNLPEERQQRLREKYAYAKWMILAEFNFHTPSCITDDSEIGGLKVNEIYD